MAVMVLLKEHVLNTERRIPSLTPCAGRCSTVFGDQVCRGCRRFNHEVIQWNTYTVEERMAVWQRLDAQLDQILVPMLPMAQLAQVESLFYQNGYVCWKMQVRDASYTMHLKSVKNKNLAEEWFGYQC